MVPPCPPHRPPLQTYFSVAALFIMFREALEAAVIISVMLQLVEKMKMPQLKKHGEPAGRGGPLAGLCGVAASAQRPRLLMAQPLVAV